MYPQPPIPDMYGSATFNAAAVATAASTAFPPACRIRIPATDASGFGEVATPRRPIATGRWASPRFGHVIVIPSPTVVNSIQRGRDCLTDLRTLGKRKTARWRNGET